VKKYRTKRALDTRRRCCGTGPMTESHMSPGSYLRSAGDIVHCMTLYFGGAIARKAIAAWCRISYQNPGVHGGSVRDRGTQPHSVDPSVKRDVADCHVRDKLGSSGKLVPSTAGFLERKLTCRLASHGK